MGWPHHLQPLPSIFADPWMYYITLESLSDELFYYSFKNALVLEIGGGAYFGELFAHVSQDLIQKLKKNQDQNNPFTRSIMVKFVQQLIEDNHKSHQEKLIQLAGNFLHSK